MNENFNFRYLRNIQTSFQLVRVLVLVVILLCFSFAGYMSWMASQTVDKSREKIYVLDGSGKSIMLALAQEQNVNREAEAKDHIKTFLKLFFNQEPDEKEIDKNMKEASYYGDESITRHYLDLREKGFYVKLLQGNATEKILIDTIGIDMRKAPYYCTIKAKILLVRATNITLRNLAADCYLVNSSRTDNNSHGFMIEKFRVYDNSDIETINRDQYDSRYLLTK